MRTRQGRTVGARGVAGIVVALTMATTVFAVDIVDDPTQIDERTTQLLQSTNSLCFEIHRFHQQEPDYPETYRIAHGLWAQAGQLQEALQAGPFETEVLMRQVTEMNNGFSQLENSISKWGDGDRSLAVLNAGPVQRTIVRPGVEVDIPFVGVRVGRPQVVVTNEGPPRWERKRLHPNSRGSKRSLVREMAAVKVALIYLSEDAGVTLPPNWQVKAVPSDSTPVPQPPVPGAAVGDQGQVVTPRATKPEAKTIPQ